MPTLKQLAVALNSDIATTKGILIEYAQSQDKFDFAKEISTTWASDTELPDWLVDFAKSKGLKLDRKRNSKKVNGQSQLANPEVIVQAFLTQLPQLISQSLITEQDAFINESSYSGAVTGAAGALAFQKALLETFAATNTAFRKNRVEGIKAMRTRVGEQFGDLYNTFCDTNREIENASLDIEQQNTEYQTMLANLQNSLVKGVTESDFETNEVSTPGEH